MQITLPKRLLHLFIFNMDETAFSGYAAYHRIIERTLSVGQTDTVSLFHAEHTDAVSGLLLGELHLILNIGSIE